MRNFLKKIPMPASGLMLSLAALGNLVQSYGNGYRNVLGILAGILFILLTIKFLTNPSGLKEDLSTPVGASVFPTYSMGIMLLATYLKPYSSEVALVVWITGIALHILLMIYFTIKYVIKFNITQVFPSWFIVYVGIAVASVTGKAFYPIVGQIAFIIALLGYLVFIPIVAKRIFVTKNIPEPALPTLIIFAAPGSLCLAGYLNSFENKGMGLFLFLLLLSQFIYLLAIIKLVSLLKLKFYPSYAGFTFPLVISAIALKTSNAFLISKGFSIGFLPVLVKIEEIIGVLIVFYVLFHFIAHIYKSMQK